MEVDRPPEELYVCSPTLRFPAGERSFTDGSLMADGGEGAAYFDESDGRAHYVRTQGDGDINRAELLGILKAIQDHRDTITVHYGPHLHRQCGVAEVDTQVGLQ